MSELEGKIISVTGPAARSPFRWQRVSIDARSNWKTGVDRMIAARHAEPLCSCDRQLVQFTIGSRDNALHSMFADARAVTNDEMDAMEDDVRILKELDDEGVLHLILNRPRRRNAFDEAQWDAFATALAEAREDPRVAVVVVSGAEGNFSSGADLSSFGGDLPPPREDGAPSGYYACINSLYDLDKPLIAAVQGIAIGGGCTLALAADLVYVGRSLRMRLPFASLGLPPEIASSYTLQAAIGRQRAAELMFTAEWIDADRAVEVGIAARAFDDDSLLPAALAKAREMAQWPISALVSIKRCLRVAHHAGIKAAREIEDAEMTRLGGSPENIEAITAFLQKRDPDFKQFRN